MTLLIILAAGLAGVLIAAPVASADDPARDEYTLDLPGARDNGLSGGGPTRSTEPLQNGEQAGVVGENLSVPSQLETATSTIFGAPLAVTVILAALAWILIAGPRLRRPQLR